MPNLPELRLCRNRAPAVLVHTWVSSVSYHALCVVDVMKRVVFPESSLS